jgi:hypothetical protein
MHTKPPTPKDMLSLEPITSPPRKKSKTTFGSSVNDSKKHLNEIEGRGGEKLDSIAM